MPRKLKTFTIGKKPRVQKQLRMKGRRRITLKSYNNYDTCENKKKNNNKNVRNSLSQMFFLKPR